MEPFLETERLAIRHLTLDDAAFIVELVNEPSWVRFIGERHVRDEADARRFLTAGYLASYERHGFGMFLVESKADGSPMGVCGLLQRDDLDAPDLGFAFLPRFWGSGYAREASEAVMTWGRETFDMGRILAITNPDNVASMRLLESLGFVREAGRRSTDDPAVVFVHAG